LLDELSFHSLAVLMTCFLIVKFKFIKTSYVTVVYLCSCEAANAGLCV